MSSTRWNISHIDRNIIHSRYLHIMDKMGLHKINFIWAYEYILSQSGFSFMRLVYHLMYGRSKGHTGVNLSKIKIITIVYLNITYQFHLPVMYSYFI